MELRGLLFIGIKGQQAKMRHFRKCGMQWLCMRMKLFKLYVDNIAKPLISYQYLNLSISIVSPC